MSGDPVKLTAARIPPQDNSLDYFKITADEANAHNVIVTFGGLFQNLPETYHNNLMVWPGSGPNLATDPLHTQFIEGNQQPNRVVFEFTFETQDYYLSYQVGKEASTMCAVCPISGFPLEIAAATIPVNVSIDVIELTTEYVKIKYVTLQGYNPTQFNNWVALWQGATTAYTTSPPLVTAEVKGGQTSGLIELAYDFVPTMNYTIAYFMGPVGTDYSHTNAGAMLIFQAQPAAG